MNKRTSQIIEVTKYCSTIRLADHDIQMTNRMRSDSPAGACLTRSERLRALTVLGVSSTSTAWPSNSRTAC